MVGPRSRGAAPRDGSPRTPGAPQVLVVIGGRFDGSAVARSLSAFLRDTGDFLLDNPTLPVGLVILAIVVFGITKPRVR